ncbi:MAG: glycosyltransferase family 4 protein [Gemmatimonadaceae bacterium]
MAGSDALPRVGIVVPTLAARGGLPALAMFLHRTLLASGRYEPSLISLATSSRDRNSVRFADPRSWRRGVQITSEDLEGGPFIHAGAFGAEVEVLRYQPRAKLTDLLNQYDIVQLVGGSPALAHIARDVTRPVALYVATMVSAERQSLLRERGLATHWRRLMTRLVAGMDRSGLRHVDVVFVINAWMRKHIAHTLGEGRVHLSPPGIDTTRFRPGSGPRDDVVLTVGRLDDPRKNIPLLVDAFAQARARLRRPIRLVLAGERAPDPKVFDRARALGVADAIDVRLKLEPAELAALYQSATVFALSSDEEGLGIAALEEMACGVPVVATRCGGPDITVVDGKTGFLVPVGDAAALGAGLERLLSDAEMCRRMGEASRARVEEQFSPERTGEIFLRVYDSLRAASPPAAAPVTP